MVKLEEGFSRTEAATFAYTSTAFPMLTGTLITAAGFVPVGFAKSSAGEYTNSIFWVVGLSLVISWFVAVLFTPWLGYRLLPQPKTAGHHDPYQGRLYSLFRRLVTWCITWRKSTIAITALAFVAAMASFGLVQKQFFPTANRPELIVDLRLDVAQVSRMLGHARPSITLDVYTHLFDRAAHAADIRERMASSEFGGLLAVEPGPA